MNRRSEWIARLFLASAGVAISAVFGEFVVARFAPQNLSIWDNTRDEMTVHRVHADVYHPRFGQRVRTNNLGMRDKERSIEKPDGTVRVLILGDSFMEALQVAYEESFPALLERAIAGNWNSVEIVNLAVSGWGTDDQVTYLERYGLRLAPDGVLIMMTLHNDVNDNALLEFHMMDEAGLRPRPVRPMPLPRYAVQSLKAYLAGTSHLYQLAYQASVRAKARRGAKQLERHTVSLLRRKISPELEQSWALTLALLDKAADMLERHGAWLAIGLIPLRVQIDDAAFGDFIAAHGLRDMDMDRDGPQRRVEAWARGRGIPLIDLLPTFSARAAESDEVLYLPEDGHWSAAGHALAAKSVAPELVSRAPQVER